MIIKNLAASLVFFLLISFSHTLIGTTDGSSALDIEKSMVDDRLLKMENLLLSIYEGIKADSLAKPSYELFKKGMIGYYNLLEKGNLSKNDLITLIDFTLPSDKKRLWVIDLKEKRILFNELVAHGRNTGNIFAENFSNVPNSHMSSQGFYLTGNTYYGQHGLSLRLQGMEAGFNDNAFERAIVIHGADYVSREFIETYGRLGRSYGCPSVSKHVSKSLIETIKGNSCLFVYSPLLEYDTRSAYLNTNVALEYLSTHDFLL